MLCCPANAWHCSLPFASRLLPRQFLDLWPHQHGLMLPALCTRAIAPFFWLPMMGAAATACTCDTAPSKETVPPTACNVQTVLCLFSQPCSLRCRYYQFGKCSKGDSCPFPHAGMPITKLISCRYFQQGSCGKVRCPVPCLLLQTHQRCGHPKCLIYTLCTHRQWLACLMLILVLYMCRHYSCSQSVAAFLRCLTSHMQGC